MEITQRTVNLIPLDELWNQEGELNSVRIRHLSADDITEIFKNGNVTFAVAEAGQELVWIEPAGCADFWNSQAKDRIVYPDDEIILEDYPEEYCYVASEWAPYANSTLILLEKYH